MKILFTSIILLLIFTMPVINYAQVKVNGGHTATNYSNAYVPAELGNNINSQKSCDSHTTVASDYSLAYIPQVLSGCKKTTQCSFINNTTVASDYSNAYAKQGI